MKKAIVFLFIFLISISICSAIDVSTKILSKVDDKNYPVVKAGMIYFLNKYHCNVVEEDQKYLVIIRSYSRNTSFAIINMEIENCTTKKIIKKSASYVFGKEKITEQDRESLKEFPSEYDSDEILCGKNIARKILETIWQMH